MQFKNVRKKISIVLSLTVIMSNTTLFSLQKTARAATLAEDLFISEYIEGSSNNKALEIYNGTGNDVDLSQYKLEVYSNGSTTAGNTLNMTGTLKNGDVYVVYNSSANDEIKAVGDVNSTVTYFNGDDGIALKKNDVIIDFFGKLGERPDKLWGEGDYSTLDHTLVRKSSITKGDSNEADAFDPSVEWVSYPKDTVNDLGKHTMDGAAEPVIILLKGLSIEGPTEVEEKKSVQLTAVYDPENATEKEVTWKSSDETVATVSQNGEVTGIKEGNSTITVTSNIHSEIYSSTEVSVKSEADLYGPSVSEVTPGENSVIAVSEKAKTIEVKYSDKSGVDTSKVILKLDGNDITSQAGISEDSITYEASKEFTEGKHNVSLEITDKLNNTTTKNWSFTIGASNKVQYNNYFGQLHSHTNISDGVGTPDEAFTYARDNAKVDFLAVTDHSNWFDNEKDLKNEDITDISQSTSTEWKQLHEIADSYNKNGEFIAIGAFEMTWSGSTGGWGHINTFNTPWFSSRSNSSMDLKAYYNKLAEPENSESISQLNHPGKTFGDFSDFGFYSEAADNVVNMIEVGNGEGPIRGSGYFPSYEYYTRALDKGWHVAPTNNQDNHKGKWGDSNTARTVVLAEDLTRDSLYEAMQERRLYSTEDNNLNIDYTVNNLPMGTILTDTNALKASINISDPDSADVIGKVSIISDGGTVVESKIFNSNTASWELDLPEGYKYYYVRVDEGDKDIAVTAPVWAGKVVPVGISKVEISQDPQIVNEPVDITALIYNNGITNLENIKVEFFQDEISDSNKIGENTIASVNAAESNTAKITWTPTKTGDIKIYARTVINVQGSDNVFTSTTSFKVSNKDDIVKVVIDAAHQNQYVSGSYAGKIETLTQMMKENELMLYKNEDELTSEDLENAELLMITDPQSKDASGLTKSNFTSEEIKVIKDFVAKGGSLIITSRADYDDKGVKDRSYESSVQGNAILEAIGSNLRFNDDEVIDNTSNGGQNYRLYFDDYVGSKYGLTDNIVSGEQYSAYSGCSVILKENGDASNVDWLVKGHDTTEILDSDSQGDNVSVEKGNVYSLATEVLPSGGKIIVAGTTFFSDFETASSDDAYSNKTITDNILNWIIEPKAAELKSIKEVREDLNEDGIPDNLGKKYSIEGVVTAQSEAIVPKNAFFEVIYVQDSTGGITVFGVSQTKLLVGQKIRITGIVDEYNNDIELQIMDETKDLTIIDSNISDISPKLLSTGDSMKEENEGWLVKVQGEVTRMDSQNIWVNDESGESRAYVEGYIGDGSDNADTRGKWDSSIKIGDTVSIIGLASEDSEGHRLRVRNTKEIVKADEIDTTAPIITISGVQEGKIYEDTTVKPEISVNEDSDITVTLNGTAYNGEVITEEGNYKLVVTAVDKAGNKTVKEISFSIKKSKDEEKTPIDSIKEQLENTENGQVISVEMGENLVITSDILELLKGQDRKVEFIVNSQGMTIIWSLNGKDIKNTETSVNLSMKEKSSNEEAIKKASPQSQIFSFENHGELPAPITLSIPVDSKIVNIEKPIYFYYYNETTKKAEVIGNPVNAYKKGDLYYIDVTIAHNSDYFITNDEIKSVPDENDNGSNDEDSNSDNNSGNGDKSESSGDKLVQTGSLMDMNTLIMVGGALIIAGVLVMLKRRNLQEK